MRIPHDKEQKAYITHQKELGTVATALDDMASEEELIVEAASKHVKTMIAFKERAQIISILMRQVENAERTMSDHERVLEAVMAQEVDITRAAEERDAFIESVSKQRAMSTKMAAYISEKPASSSEEKEASASSSKEKEASEEEEDLEDEEASVEEVWRRRGRRWHASIGAGGGRGGQSGGDGGGGGEG
jgi:hypothetical protein